MATEYNLSIHEAFIEVKVTGNFELHNARDNFPILLAACKLHNCYRILVDFTEIDQGISFSDKFSYALDIEHIIINDTYADLQLLKLAYLGREEMGKNTPNVDLPEHLVAARLFTDKDKAVEWLEDSI